MVENRMREFGLMRWLDQGYKGKYVCCVCLRGNPRVEKRVWEHGLVTWLDQGILDILVGNVGDIEVQQVQEKYIVFEDEDEDKDEIR
ncbi:hypothetical protein Tco_1152813 [Tanacetum coccineum]